MLKKLREKLKWLDPFTYVDVFILPKINPNNDKNIETIVYIIFAFIFAFVLYNFILAFILGTDAPLVIVFSGSMEPVLFRGDVVVLTGVSAVSVKEVNLDFPIKDKRLSEYAEIGSRSVNSAFRHDSIQINGTEYEFDPNGEIVVYNSPIRQQDIIHRAVLQLNAPDGSFVLTLGDNNTRLDQDCKGAIRNCIIGAPIPIEDLRGKYLIHIPLIGYVKLLLFDDLPNLIRQGF